MLVLAHPSNSKTKSLFTPWKLSLTKPFNFEFCANNAGFDRYLIQLIVLSKPYFNYGNKFTLSWVDKVTTGI